MLAQIVGCSPIGQRSLQYNREKPSANLPQELDKPSTGICGCTALSKASLTQGQPHPRTASPKDSLRHQLDPAVISKKSRNSSQGHSLHWENNSFLCSCLFQCWIRRERSPSSTPHLQVSETNNKEWAVCGRAALRMP